MSMTLDLKVDLEDPEALRAAARRLHDLAAMLDRREGDCTVRIDHAPAPGGPDDHLVRGTAASTSSLRHDCYSVWSSTNADAWVREATGLTLTEAQKLSRRLRRRGKRFVAGRRLCPIEALPGDEIEDVLAPIVLPEEVETSRPPRVATANKPVPPRDARVGAVHDASG